MAKRHLRLVTPATVNRTVTPKRFPNSKLRTREYLTEVEVERVMNVARKNRWGHRDATMVLVAYRHGLRVSELVDMRWEQIEFASGTLHVRRVKQGTPSTHPILGDELRALRRLKREQEPASPFVFTSERGAPFSTAGFARMVERAGSEARLAFKAHPHMLRHACGYTLANKGHDTRALQAYLGHRNIQHTVRYTELSPTRFKGANEQRSASPCVKVDDAGGAMVDEAHFNSRCDQLLFATMATVSLMMKLARFSDGSSVPGRYVAGPRASRVSFMAKKERDASRHWRLGA